MGPLRKRIPPCKPLSYLPWPKYYELTRQMAESSLWPFLLWVRYDKVNFFLKVPFPHLFSQHPGPSEPSWGWEGLAAETFEAALVLYISLKIERTALKRFAGWGCKVCCNYSYNLISLKILCCVLTAIPPKQGHSFIWSALKATCNSYWGEPFKKMV